MNYTPTNWQTGDIVSSQRLNKLEGGVKDAYEVMVINDDDGTLDKTWQEIYDAMAQGKLCLVKVDKGTPEDGIQNGMINVVSSGSGYIVRGGANAYSASSATGYPKANGPS